MPNGAHLKFSLKLCRLTSQLAYKPSEVLEEAPHVTSVDYGKGAVFEAEESVRPFTVLQLSREPRGASKHARSALHT